MNSAQVSLNWLIQKHVIPIPGAKNADQVMQNNQAVGWSLTEDQVTQLDDLSAVILKLRSG
jgi:diketogulonate reductase-like aldo/keto reductase